MCLPCSIWLILYSTCILGCKLISNSFIFLFLQILKNCSFKITASYQISCLIKIFEKKSTFIYVGLTGNRKLNLVKPQPEGYFLILSKILFNSNFSRKLKRNKVKKLYINQLTYRWNIFRQAPRKPKFFRFNF